MARILPAAAGSDPGSVATFAMATPPRGWLKCNGEAVSRDDYPRLFAAIGTLHGDGDGSTTFNLPDMRGEFPRGLDDGRGVDSGRALGSHQGEAMQRHNHAASTSINTNGSHSHGRPTWQKSLDSTNGLKASTQSIRAARNDIGLFTSGPRQWSLPNNGNHSHSANTSVSNQGGPETRPRNVALLFAIKT